MSNRPWPVLTPHNHAEACDEFDSFCLECNPEYVDFADKLLESGLKRRESVLNVKNENGKYVNYSDHLGDIRNCQTGEMVMPKQDYRNTTETEQIMSEIDLTLQERGTKYGKFTEHARITQNIKRAMMDSPNWTKLSDDQRESLEMLAHKFGRILNGDPNYHDSWHDIVGYAKLVADRLVGLPEV